MPIAGAAIAGAGVLGNVGTTLYGSAQQRRLQRQQESLRAQALADQIKALESQTSPQMSSYMQNYQEELARQSGLRDPIGQDIMTQGARSALLGQGVRNLASVAGAQKAANIQRGGFSNIGSIQDIQDRMSQAMAQLAERTQQGRLSRLGEAAQLQQAYIDKLDQFNNARKQAIAAAYSGDLGAALQGIQQAQAIAAQQGQQMGNVFSGITGIGAGIINRSSEKSDDQKLLEFIKGNKGKIVDYTPSSGSSSIT